MAAFKINKKNLGILGETMAADYLRRCDYKILERNYRYRYGEIDIIAGKNGTLAFVEVKFRSSYLYGSSIESVNQEKVKKIRRTAAHYLNSTRIPFYSHIRFDLICLELRDSIQADKISNIDKTTSVNLQDIVLRGDPTTMDTFLRDLRDIVKIDHIKNAF